MGNGAHYKMHAVKISGFTILRSAVRLGYPFEASLRSLLPLVDELIVGVGDDDDGTWEAVSAIGDERIRPFRSQWRLPSTGGLVLSEQTNLALARCTGDWAIYLQGDEVLHEDDLQPLREALIDHQHRRTEGLVFSYLHFWRDHRHVADDWLRFYPRAVRAVKRLPGIESAGDACGFMRRRGNRTRGLIKAASGARVFHYGWCNPPALQAMRVENLGRQMFSEHDRRENAQRIFANDASRLFTETHPSVMAALIGARPEPSDQQLMTNATPAWLRAVWQVARSPIASRHAARPFLPLSVTNAWWRVVG
jgi:hypothetical protein